MKAAVLHEDEGGKPSHRTCITIAGGVPWQKG
jgi:hypothetical protein